MQFYSDEIIDEVLSANDITDVIGSYVKLEKKGKYLFGLCPFHREKTGSFSVTPSKQIYYCYSCQKGGNAIHFIMGVENLSFVEALKFLADRGKIALPETLDKKDAEKIKLKKDIVHMHTEAARFFHKMLSDKDGLQAKAYLMQRNLTENTITKFGLGYAPKKGDSLLRHCLQLGFDKSLIRKCGLFLENAKGEFFDRFRGRVMFPIFDLRGSVIAFGGRVMDDTLPKYMNSPETPVYHKGRNLYGLNFVRKTGDKKIIIVEGYMDVISLHQNGIVNAVASLGTALTEEQGRLLRMYGEEIIIAYDADQAGQNATMRGLDILDELGCNVKVLSVPNGKDPDEYVKMQGKDSFMKLVGRAQTLLEYKVSLIKDTSDLTTTAGKIEFLNKTSAVLAKIDNAIERDMYIKKLSQEYAIREDALSSEIEKKRAVKSNKKAQFDSESNRLPQNHATLVAASDPKVTSLEKLLIALLCVDNAIIKHLETELKPHLFRGQAEKQLIETVLKKLKAGTTMTPAELLANLSEDQSSEYVRILDKECTFEDNVKAFRDILKKLEAERLNQRQQEILDILKRNDINDEIHIAELKRELSFILSQKKNF